MAKATKPETPKSKKRSDAEGSFRLNISFEEAMKLAATTPIPKTKKKAKK